MSLPIERLPDYTEYRRIGTGEIESPILRTAYAYWLNLRAGRRFPARGDIKPRDIAGLLRHICLIKVDGDDFIYRIVGDVIVVHFGLPLHNRRLSDLVYDEPGFGMFMLPSFRRVVKTGEPSALRGRIGRDVTHLNFTDSENLHLPLGPDDQTVDHILSVVTYTSQPCG